MYCRYLIEISDGPATHYTFAYMDTVDNLADFLFDHLKVDVERELEFHVDGDPFKIVLCRVPLRQREEFLDAVDLLPALMDYAGKTGYDEYCRDFLADADRFLAERGGPRGITPLQ